MRRRLGLSRDSGPVQGNGHGTFSLTAKGSGYAPLAGVEGQIQGLERRVEALADLQAHHAERFEQHHEQATRSIGRLQAAAAETHQHLDALEGVRPAWQTVVAVTLVVLGTVLGALG